MLFGVFHGRELQRLFHSLAKARAYAREYEKFAGKQTVFQMKAIRH